MVGNTMSGKNEKTEPTDPARRLGLLWGDRHHSARRGKHELNLAKIVAAGTALADESGVAALSMRKVAERLGVGTMSLYTYVPGKDDLIEVMIDTVYAGIAEAGRDEANDAAEAGRGGVDADSGSSGDGMAVAADSGLAQEPQWRQRLTAVAANAFQAHLAHAWLVRLPTDRVVLGPGAAAKYERELAAVDGVGLSDVEMDGVVSLVGGHVVASAKRVVDAAESRRTSGMTEEQWWRANAPLLAAFADRERFPTAARVGATAGREHGAAYAADGGFAFGLSRILDGVTLLIDARGSGG